MKGTAPASVIALTFWRLRYPLVRRDFLHREVLSGRTQQGRKKGSIMPLAVRDLDGGDDVGLGAAHQVSLEPFTPRITLD